MDQPIIWYKGLTKLDFHISNSAKIYINLKYNTYMYYYIGERSMKFTSSHKDCSLLLILF